MADIWTSVSMPYLRPSGAGNGDAWAEEAAQQGHVGTQQLLEVAEVTPPPEVAEALGLAPGGTAIVRRRLMLIDDRPVELTDSYYPQAIAAGTALAEHRKIKGGALRALVELGYQPAPPVQEDVSARLPTERERDLLALEENDPVLILLRVLRSHGQPVEVSLMTMVAEGRRLRYQLTAS